MPRLPRGWMTRNEAQALTETALLLLFVVLVILVILMGVGDRVYNFFVQITGAQPWIY